MNNYLLTCLIILVTVTFHPSISEANTCSDLPYIENNMTLVTSSYTFNKNKINLVVTIDIVLRILLLGICGILVTVFAMGKMLVFLNRDEKDLDNFLYAKSVRMPPHQLNLMVFLYIFTTILYFTVGRSLWKEYICSVTGNNFDYIDQMRPEVDYLKKFIIRQN